MIISVLGKMGCGMSVCFALQYYDKQVKQNKEINRADYPSTCWECIVMNEKDRLESKT